MSTSRRYCCIKGCSNTPYRLHGVDPLVKFYSFPESTVYAPWKSEKRNKLINAVKNYVKNSKDWEPTRNTKICSAHFINNTKSEHPSHPSYLPTIFPGKENEKLKTGKVELKKIAHNSTQRSRDFRARAANSIQSQTSTADPTTALPNLVVSHATLRLPRTTSKLKSKLDESIAEPSIVSGASKPTQKKVNKPLPKQKQTSKQDVKNKMANKKEKVFQQEHQQKKLLQKRGRLSTESSPCTKKRKTQADKEFQSEDIPGLFNDIKTEEFKYGTNLGDFGSTDGLVDVKFEDFESSIKQEEIEIKEEILEEYICYSSPLGARVADLHRWTDDTTSKVKSRLDELIAEPSFTSTGKPERALESGSSRPTKKKVKKSPPNQKQTSKQHPKNKKAGKKEKVFYQEHQQKKSLQKRGLLSTESSPCTKKRKIETDKEFQSEEIPGHFNIIKTEELKCGTNLGDLGSIDGLVDVNFEKFEGCIKQEIEIKEEILEEYVYPSSPPRSENTGFMNITEYH